MCRILLLSLQINYFFYKASLFVFSIFVYNALTMFSGTTIFSDWYITLYQVLFTALPVIAVGVLDQDVKPFYRLRYPYLYQHVSSRSFTMHDRSRGSMHVDSLLKRTIAYSFPALHLFPLPLPLLSPPEPAES